MREDENQERHKYNNRILIEGIYLEDPSISHLLLLRCAREVEEQKETFDRSEISK